MAVGSIESKNTPPAEKRQSIDTKPREQPKDDAPKVRPDDAARVQIASREAQGNSSGNDAGLAKSEEASKSETSKKGGDEAEGNSSLSQIA